MAYQSKNPKFDSLILKDNAAGSVDAPASGSTKVINRGGQLFEVDSSGAETLLADGGGSGEINYILNYGFEDGNITGWSTYDDGASATPVDGTGGSPSTLTLTLNDTTPIRGLYDLQVAKSAADSQGEGFSYDFTIDEIDTNKLLKIQFDMDTTDANYTAGDLVAYIYDVDNAALITPSSVSIPSVLDTFAVSFVSTDSTNYRLIFHWAVTTASAAELHFDQFIVGPGKIVQGGVVGPWEDFTPSWSGLSSGTLRHSRKRRVGDSMEINILYTAATTSSTLILTVPDGLSVNSSETINLGYMTVDAQIGTLTAGLWARAYRSSGGTTIQFFVNNTLVGNGAAGALSSDIVSFNLVIPIQEWVGGGTLNLLQEDNLSAWQALTVTTNITSGQSSSSFKYKRVGDSMRIRGRLGFSGALTVTGSTIAFTLPSGFTIDYDKLPSSTYSYVGSATADEAGVGGAVGAIVTNNGATNSFIFYGGDAQDGVWTASAPFTFGASDAINIQELEVPIVEWRSSQNSTVGFSMASSQSAGLVSTTTQEIVGVKSFKGNNTNDDFITTFDAPIGTTDPNWAEVVLRDSSNSNSVRAGLGMKYESSPGPGVAGYLKLVARDNSINYFWMDDADVLRTTTSGSFGNVGNNAGTVVGTQTSDERLKSKIQDLNLGLEAVLKLQPIRYILNGKEEIGFGAQTTEKIIPEAVYETGEELEPGDRSRLAMDYVRIIPVLVNAIKELKVEIELLKKER